MAQLGTGLAGTDFHHNDEADIMLTPIETLILHSDWHSAPYRKRLGCERRYRTKAKAPGHVPNKLREGNIMAIRLQFINVVVPLKNIEKKCTSIGGWNGFLATEGSFGWYDKYLYRTGAMTPMDAKAIVDKFEQYGLTPIGDIDGIKTWKDICVVDYLMGPTLPCSWIEYENDYVWLRDTPRGKIVGPRKQRARKKPVDIATEENPKKSINIIFEFLKSWEDKEFISREHNPDDLYNSYNEIRDLFKKYPFQRRELYMIVSSNETQSNASRGTCTLHGAEKLLGLYPTEYSAIENADEYMKFIDDRYLIRLLLLENMSTLNLADIPIEEYPTERDVENMKLVRDSAEVIVVYDNYQVEFAKLQ